MWVGKCWEKWHGVLKSVVETFRNGTGGRVEHPSCFGMCNKPLLHIKLGCRGSLHRILFSNKNIFLSSCKKNWLQNKAQAWNKMDIFTRFECKHLEYVTHKPMNIIWKKYNHKWTDSLWRRQSQQSFNTLTPFNFLFYSLHVSVSTGHPQVRYTISYYFCFWRTILIQRIHCTYAIWL
jgi:hypothetical protein